MTITPSIRYPGQVDTDEGFPWGKARNHTSTQLGTPFEAALLNDVWGWHAALASSLGLTPSGQADHRLESQLFNALQALIDSGVLGRSQRYELRACAPVNDSAAPRRLVLPPAASSGENPLQDVFVSGDGLYAIGLWRNGRASSVVLRSRGILGTFGAQLQNDLMGPALRGQGKTALSLTMRPDGRQLFVLLDGGVIIARELARPWQISSLAPALRVVLVDEDLAGLAWSRDGRRVLAITRLGVAKSFTLSSPFDMGEATLLGALDLTATAQEAFSELTGIDVTPDGRAFVVTGRFAGETLHRTLIQYTMSSPWDARTAVRDYRLDINASRLLEESGTASLALAVRGVQYRSDGFGLYVGAEGGGILQLEAVGLNR